MHFRRINMKSTKSLLDKFHKVVGQDYCEKHDVTYKLREMPYGVRGCCSECWEEEKEEETKREIRQAMEKQKNWADPYIKKWEHVSIDLKEAELTDYQPKNESQEKAKKIAFNYTEKFNGKNSLVLSGRPGLGKSHLAYSITKELRKQGYKTLFIKSTELLDLFRSTYQEGVFLTEERIFKLIKSIDLLVIDDMGSEYVKQNAHGHETWASDLLYKIFDIRLGKAVLCTTNYTEIELEKKYGYNGERIVSRMMENAFGMRIEGPDHRRKNNF